MCVCVCVGGGGGGGMGVTDNHSNFMQKLYSEQLTTSKSINKGGKLTSDVYMHDTICAQGLRSTCLR